MAKLRQYQIDAIESVDKYFIAKRGSNPLIIAPTASGKSHIIAGYIGKQLKAYPQCRFMMVTHQQELIEQNHEKFNTAFPEFKAGIYSAGLKQRDSKSSVVFAGIQSVYNKTKEIGKVDVLMIDEAHMIPVIGNGRYITFIKEMTAINPLLKVVGLTATPYRLNNGLLYEGRNRIFDGIAYEISVKHMLENGYITPLITPDTPLQTSIDTTGIEISNISNDFFQTQLKARISESDLIERAVKEMYEKAKDRKSWIVFAQSIEHAERISAELENYGVTSEVITGKTFKEHRRARLIRFKKGYIRCLVNVNVLTTGFDAPNVDMIAMLRPTMSTSLYIQMLGRGVRIADNKKDCLVLDFAGNIEQHGTFDNPHIDNTDKTKKDSGGQAPTKDCPNCSESVHAGVRYCGFCGFEFPKPEQPKFSDFVSNLDLLSYDNEGEKTWPVAFIDTYLHRKNGSPDSCRVEFMSMQGRRICAEYLCFEHKGFARHRACIWWSQVMPEFELPLTSMQAVTLIHQYGRNRISRIVTTNHKSMHKTVLRRELDLPKAVFE